MARKKKTKDGEPRGAPPARIDHVLTVLYDTATHGPPHTVAVRSSVNDWVDVPMASIDADGVTTWSADLRAEPDQGPIEVEFKLFLDGEHWMAGENQRGTMASPPGMATFDDSAVAWES